MVMTLAAVVSGALIATALGLLVALLLGEAAGG
jgi:biopolymer transport protein ExbB/TolQ